MNEDGTDSAPVRDVIIVGTGVAGFSAAVYAARADLETLEHTVEEALEVSP